MTSTRTIEAATSEKYSCENHSEVRDSRIILRDPEMFDPSTVTLGQLSSTLRDFTIVGILAGGAWKARGVFESGKNFFNRLIKFMDTMEADSIAIKEGVQLILSNHLTHIEQDLKTLAGRKEDVVDVDSEVI